MALGATPSGTKRGHPDADDEAQTPLALKKRKLEQVNGTQSPSTPKALGAISSVIGGIFGYGRSQPNGAADETQEAPNGHPPNNLNGEAPQVQQAIPPPVEEVPKPRPRPALKAAFLRGTEWDPDAGKDPPPKPAKRSSASPRKVATTKGSQKAAKSPIARKVISSNGVDGWDSDEGADKQSPSVIRSVKRMPGATNGDLTNGYPGSPQGTPSKNGYSVARSLTGSPAPRSILTPTKKRGPKPQKSVTFGGKSSGGLIFEDIPKTPQVLKKKPGRPPKSKKKDEEEADDIVCAICSRADSKAPNEIILCDNCDFAVHQECYEVPEIPEGDWLCKSCAQEDVLKTPGKPADGALDSTPVAELPDIPNLDRHVRSLQRVLLDRCSGRRRLQMFGQQEAYGKARQLVEQTVLAGEGNSMLLIGARGCGKTTLVENVIEDLSKEHRHEFHVVRLNGFIHTDDKLALREIWRQLGKEMAVEDDLVSRTNYADTMASLLALLSHPSEISGKEEGVTSQSVIFVIDEFDMFASHPRQTLLYNLFDIAQSRKAPVAVLGCTTRLDVVDMLEKRVKSRFSHRYVYLALPRSLPAFWQVCRQGLMVDKSDAEREGIDSTVEGCDDFRKYWNHKIEELYKKRTFQNLLQYHYYATKSVSAFFGDWLLPLSALSATNLNLEPPTTGSKVALLAPPDSCLQLLSTLSDLDLSLLIAAARLDIIAHTDTVNFAMAYDEYSSLVGRQRVQSAASGMLALGGGARVWSRGVAAIAWERLVSLGLLVPAGFGGGYGGGKGSRSTTAQGGLDSKMWKMEVALEEIPTAVKLNNVLARWCKEL